MTIETGAELVVPEALYWGLVLKFVESPTPKALATAMAAATEACRDLGATRTAEGDLRFTVRVSGEHIVAVEPGMPGVLVVSVES